MKSFEELPAMYSEDPLSRMRIREFLERDLSDAARYLLKTEFSDVGSRDRTKPAEMSIESPDGPDEIRLFFGPGDRRHHEFASLVVGIEGFLPDLTDVIPATQRKLTIWEETSYVFPIEKRQRPFAKRSLIAKNIQGRRIDPAQPLSDYLKLAAQQFGIKTYRHLAAEDLRILQTVIEILCTPRT